MMSGWGEPAPPRSSWRCRSRIGGWLRNSPARRVPSHGVDLLGQRYAIDFVGVDERGRTAYRRD